jgi:hypothetical protein
VVRSSFLSRRYRTARKQFNQQDSDSSVVGWISITDCLLLGLGVLLAVSFYFKNEKKVAESRLATSNAALEESLNSREQFVKDFEKRASSWAKKLKRLGEEFQVNEGGEEALKVSADMLEKQSEKIQKLEEEKNLAKAKHDDISFRYALLQKLQISNKNAVRRLREQFSVKSKQENKDEILLRRELVGFKGDLQRVAFLIDNSGSMKERWDNAKTRIMQWITSLNVGECIVITFNDYDKVVKWPRKADGTYLISKNAKQPPFNEIRQVLENSAPAEGGTDTYQAFEKAYAFKGVDTIILFTDGAPWMGKEYVFKGQWRKPESEKAGNIDYDKFLIQEVQDLCQENKHIPINIVGVGNYTEPNFANFLLQLAKISDGTFLGRGD